MSNWTQEEQASTINALMKRCAEDPVFRKSALADPSAAVKSVSGKELPPNFNLRLIENNGADLTLALPDPIGEDLSDADLEAVAGGGKLGPLPFPLPLGR